MGLLADAQQVLYMVPPGSNQFCVAEGAKHVEGCALQLTLNLMSDYLEQARWLPEHRAFEWPTVSTDLVS